MTQSEKAALNAAIKILCERQRLISDKDSADYGQFEEVIFFLRDQILA